MRPTLQFIQERFDFFNRLVFEGRLPRIRIRISSSVRSYGSLRHPRVFRSAPKASDFTLSVSDRLDLDRAVIEDTLIHEMIHLYILYFRIEDTSAHGPEFRRMMNEINSRHGRNITVSRRADSAERASDRIVRPRLVIVSELAGGECAVTVCSPRSAARFAETLRSDSRIRKWDLYLSADPVFAAYPLSRTLRFYRIAPAELARVLRDARRVVYDGKFRIASGGNDSGDCE